MLVKEQEVYDVIEVATIYGHLIGKLVKNEGRIILKDALILTPTPQGVAFKPIGHLSLITEISIERQFVLGYSKISDLEVVKKYEDTIVKLNAAFSGLEIPKDTAGKIRKIDT